MYIRSCNTLECLPYFWESFRPLVSKSARIDQLLANAEIWKLDESRLVSIRVFVEWEPWTRKSALKDRPYQPADTSQIQAVPCSCSCYSVFCDLSLWERTSDLSLKPCFQCLRNHVRDAIVPTAWICNACVLRAALAAIGTHAFASSWDVWHFSEVSLSHNLVFLDFDLFRRVFCQFASKEFKIIIIIHYWFWVLSTSSYFNMNKLNDEKVAC